MFKIKNKSLWILAIVGLIVFFGATILNNQSGLFISPDETANAFFAERFSITQSLQWFDPINIDLNDSIHPRSVVSVAGILVPISFTGLPVLYGFIVSIFGQGTITFLTPLIALISVFALYGICRRIFSEKIALFSAALWAIHPAWWYYSARTLMHNVLFVSLVILSVYILVAKPFKDLALKKVSGDLLQELVKNIDYVVAGLFFGTAIFVRTSEVLWLASAFLLVALILKRKIYWSKVIIFVTAVVLALVPMFVVNQQTYGHPLTFGYQVEKTVTSDLVVTNEGVGEKIELVQEKSAVRQKIEQVLSPIFPFGIAPRAVFKNVFSYSFLLFGWLTILAAIGLSQFLPNKKQENLEKRKRIAYLSVFGLVFVWLGVMYGSWVINDNPDPNALTIANSYVRYWLPIYLLMTPLAAIGSLYLIELTKKKAKQKIVLGVIVLVCSVMSIWTVFLFPSDGLLATSHILDRSIDIRTRVFTHVEPEAVIIVDRADKIFWPERRVRYPLRDETTFNLMSRMSLRVPLYYYGITFPQEDIDYLNQIKLEEDDLQISLIETFDEESLYWITQIR